MNKDYGVVVIARDEEKNIEACLSAIVDSDTCPLWAIVDDRTSDRTAELARKYTANVFMEHGSRGRLRNVGCDGAGLPFIAYVDADMIVTPKYLETLRSAMDDDARLSVAAGAQIPMGCCRLGALDCEYWNYRRGVGAGGSMFRVAAINESGGFRDELNVGEDGELISRMTAMGWRKKWIAKARIGHYYAPTVSVWHNKIAHGHAAGVKARGMARLLASPLVGLHAAVLRRQPHMLWYVPLRSLTLLKGPGARSEYVPQTGTAGGL